MSMHAIESITKNLVFIDGVWTSKNAHTIHYPGKRREILFLTEERSFWFRHRNRCILSILEQFQPQGLFIDLGSGNGFVSRAIEQSGFDLEVISVEPGLEGCLNAQKRGLKNITCGTIEDLSFDKIKVDAIGVFDVIEYIQDENSFFERVHYALKNDGKLFISVPAYQWLWSHHDELTGHFRRYTVQNLQRSLECNGFQLIYESYFFSFLVLPIFFFRRLPYLLGAQQFKIDKKSDEGYHLAGTFLRHLADFCSRVEYGRLMKSRIGFGTSILAVATKR